MYSLKILKLTLVHLVILADKSRQGNNHVLNLNRVWRLHLSLLRGISGIDDNFITSYWANLVVLRTIRSSF